MLDMLMRIQSLLTHTQEENALKVSVRPIVSKGVDLPPEDKPQKKQIRFNAQLEQYVIQKPIDDDDAICILYAHTP